MAINGNAVEVHFMQPIRGVIKANPKPYTYRLTHKLQKELTTGSVVSMYDADGRVALAYLGNPVDIPVAHWDNFKDLQICYAPRLAIYPRSGY